MLEDNLSHSLYCVHTSVQVSALKWSLSVRNDSGWDSNTLHVCAVLCSLNLMQEHLTEGLWTLNIAPCPSFWHNWTGWRCLLGDISQWKSKYSILKPCFQFGGTWFELGSCLLRWVSGRVSLRTEVSESFLYTHRKTHPHLHFNYQLCFSF